MILTVDRPPASIDMYALGGAASPDQYGRCVDPSLQWAMANAVSKCIYL